MKINRLLFFIVLLSVAVAAISPAAYRPETVRVAIARGVEEVKVDGDGLLVSDDRGDAVAVDMPCSVRRSLGGTLVMGGISSRRFIFSSPSLVKINGRGYRGVIELHPVDKGILVVNELPLEEYLVGLINCEISSLWPIEAVKAQAVIARSYAIYQKDNRKGALYHLESSVMDQVYNGADIEDSRAARAVKETEGEVLVHSGNIIQAFYHSNCGGHTEAAVNVWGADIPYLQGVECRYCVNTPPARWELTLSLKKIESLLKSAGHQFGSIREIRGGRLNDSGRLQNLILVTSRGDSKISAVNFRKAVGYSVLKSTNFTLRQRGDEIIFSGAGNGHGVGLCQWGAKQRAGDGFSYREILNYYYPGVRLERLKG
ncbi:MAG TPA: SpoIID/LytB domain-containing protein [Geobacteraceae bacterium]|nr:SpoIID/LytB domain-containing protein [Geobacteraceae bacterium]